MQHQLRHLLEEKVARGGDYYFDMDPSGAGMHHMMAGDMEAGRRRRRVRRRVGRGGKKPAHMVKGSAAAKRHMAKIRRMKGHGGDFVDYNDLSMYDGGDFVDLDDLALYTGGAKIKHAHRKAARGAKVGNYRNPIEQAERNAYKRQKQADWLLTEGPAYAAKLRRKAQYINDALVNTDTNDLGRDYNLLYANELQRMSGYAPYSKAALKYNLRPAAPALPAGDQYNAYIAALTRARNRALGIVPQAANLEEIGH